MRRSAGKVLLATTAALTVTGLGIGTAVAGSTPARDPGGRAATVTPNAAAPTRAAIAPGICPTGATPGPALPARTVTATRIRGGFSFLEGPVWDARSGTLLFSDMRSGTGSAGVQPSTIRRYTPPATVNGPAAFDTWVTDAGSNGLALSPDGGTVLAATHDSQSVSSYRLADRFRTQLAGTFDQRPFNSPNDLTVRSDRTIYFTDPSFQRANRTGQPGGRTGVYRIAPDGRVSLVDGTVEQPNGIVLSPDEKTLYVGGNRQGQVYRYPVNADGSTGARSNFAPVRGADGATVDCAGNVYWASYDEGQVYVFSPAGTQLGTITAGRNTTNLAFGGPDRRTLFVTSGTWGDFGLYSVRLGVPGNPY